MTHFTKELSDGLVHIHNTLESLKLTRGWSILQMNFTLLPNLPLIPTRLGCHVESTNEMQ